MKLVTYFLAFLFVTAGFGNEPRAIGYVNDFARLYSSSYVQKLETSLRELSKNKGPEIAIVTLPSSKGKSIDTQANILFDAWSIGKKEEDNGLLLLVIPSERSMRIEVGYGLEPKLPDHICGNIIRDILAPHFKEGKYEEGTTKAIESIIQRIGTSVDETETSTGGWVSYLVIFLVGGLWLFIILFGRRNRGTTWINRGKGSGFGGSGGGFGGFGGGSSGGGGASGRW